MMPRIEGTSEAWAEWIERWYATSTLTPKVRATFRRTMSKAGRWLAAEHPEITEPGHWTPADLRRVGRGRGPDEGRGARRSGTAGLSERAGEPISPRTKAGAS